MPEFGAWAFLQLRTSSCAGPAELPEAGWRPVAAVPVAALPPPDEVRWTAAALEESEFWYRGTLLADGPGILRCGGLATIAEVWVDGSRVLQSDNMFLRHDIALPAAADGPRRVHLCFRSTGLALRARKVGRARWRPRLATAQGLRTVRTSLLGRMAGWSPPIPCVGPWRSITWLDGRPTSPPVLLHADLRATLDGGDGRVEAKLEFAATLPAGVEVELIVGGHSGRLVRVDGTSVGGGVSLVSPAPWWPHTHGAPALYEANVRVGEAVLPLGRVGFRTVAADLGDDRRGFGLVVNGVAVFCRGACWTSADLAGMPWSEAALRPWLEAARDAGMNMLRVGGTMAYEAESFFALCDELGIMVWQDLMLANFDYPEHDPAFGQSLRAEIGQLLRRTAAHPCLAVLCGGSEVMQQAAMLGLPSEVWQQALYRTTIPDLLRRHHAELVYVENSPSGGALPFCTDNGVTHYYGVGAYLRPLDDARRSGVRFASECLAFANVPCAETIARHLPGIATTDPRWKAAVPRDPGAGWDFEDVRDHYLKLLFGVDPTGLRHVDAARYLDLSRATGCLVAERVFAEWRRQGSGCAGGLVWQLQDLAPGAGWGVIDSDGRPKPVWHALRRAFRPRQLALTDEGLNGLALHVVNEAADCLEATVRLVCLRDGEVPVRSVRRRVSVPGRTTERLSSQDLLPEFFDINDAYRFGPRTHDVVSASLWHEPADGEAVLLAYDHHVLAWAAPVRDLGLQAVAVCANGRWELHVTTRQFRPVLPLRPRRSRRRGRLVQPVARCRPHDCAAAAFGGRAAAGRRDPGAQPAGERVRFAQTMTATDCQALYFAGCLGWTHLPRSLHAGRRGVVLCAPLGDEALGTYNAWRGLADRLAAAGMPVLRFDYPTSGDSLFADGERPGLVPFLDCIQQAAALLRERFEVAEVALCGLRLGATLASLAAARVGAARLVALAPFVNGRTYVRELRAGARMLAAIWQVPAAIERDGWFEAMGVRWDAQTRREIEATDLLRLDERPAPTALLIAPTGRLPALAELADRWRDLGCAAAVEPGDDLDAYLQESVIAVAPQVTLDRVVAWLAAGAPADGRRMPPPENPPLQPMRVGEACEQPVRFGSGTAGSASGASRCARRTPVRRC